MPRLSEVAGRFAGSWQSPPATEAWRSGDVHLWIGGVSAAETSADWYLLDPAERKQAKWFRAEADRRAFIARRAEVKRILAQYCHCSPADLAISKGVFGKPLLPGISFNWSRTGESWAMAVAPNGHVGVDIEHVTPDIEWPTLLSIACHPIERDFIMAGGDTACRRFFQIWARKEAFLKATGIGLIGNLAEICVMPGLSQHSDGYANGIREITDLTIEADLAGAMATDFPLARILCFEQFALSNHEIMWNLQRPAITV